MTSAAKIERVSIGDLVDNGAIVQLQDGNHGERHPKARDYVADGIPFIMANNIQNGVIEIESAQKIPEQLASSLRIGFAKVDDVLLTHKGTIGSTAIVRAADPYLMLTPQVTYYRVNPAHLDNWYLHYAFQDRHFQRVMKSRADQATRPYIGITAQRQLKVLITDLKTQKRIVSYLRPYDDLIENNRRRIALLERAARELYREWFVWMRFPGHEHTRIVDGVPEGWERKRLGEIAAANVESYRAKELPEELNYIDISSVSEGRILDKKRMASTEAPGRARRKARHGDVIWSNVRPNLKAYSPVLNPEVNDVFSTGFTILSARDIPFTFLYQHVTTDQFVSYLVNQTTGASYPAVRPDDFERAEIVVPTASRLDEFHTFCEPNYELIARLTTQNRHLAQARDLLLPHLMNGSLSV